MKKEQKQPLVSVIIPTYNRKHTLKRCIDSVLKQTYSNLEIILVDDCSDDGTLEWVDETYGSIEEINIIYVRNDTNLGAAASRNVGISYANGEFVAFHDSDDEWHPDKLRRQMDVMLQYNQNVGAVYTLFAPDGTDSVPFPPKEVEMVYKSGYIFETLLLNSLIGMITLLVRKSVLLEVGGFVEELNALEDYELTLRIAKHYAVILLDEVLAVAYSSENSVSSRNRDKIIAQCYMINVYHKDLERAGLLRRKLEMVYQESVSYQLEDFFCQCVMQFGEQKDKQFVQEKWEMLHPSSKPEQLTTQDISSVQNCSGCMACYNACPVGAITMEADEEGFLMPKIEENKCIHCGKCKTVCPAANETEGFLLPEDCYAVMADENVRRLSSSGGVFPVLAEKMLEEGGYVAGAVWDEKFSVKHIVSNQIADIRRMYSSKYVQSNIGNVYREAEELLQQGHKVLFSGCGCQLAGLHNYLGRPYENLFLIEIICHGVPSQELLDAYLPEREKIAEISFRKKDVFGWKTGFYRKDKNGAEYKPQKDSYISAYLGNWTMRKSCYQCQFKSKKYGDILLGDFWGINRIAKFDDGMGTSLVTLNTTKGAYLFKSVLEHFTKIVSVKTALAEGYNSCMTQAVREPKTRELFFEEWKNRNGRSLDELAEAVKSRIHFDIALVYMWGYNYGNALTNFALYQYLKMQGKSLVVLNNFCPLQPVKQFADFAEKKYELSSFYFPNYDYAMLNQCCDAFVVGSDQNWNYSYAQYYRYGNYFQLEFVADSNKKLSYATSFGKPEAALSADAGKALYQRFDAISVREEFGVGLCRQEYDAEAVWVLDPVFLLEKEAYEELLLHNNQKTVKPPEWEQEPYIAAYLLNPTLEKRDLCLRISRKLGNMKIINLMDANLRQADYNLKVLEYDNIKVDLTVEEWLSYLKNAAFVVTDSYHGTCFSMIFEKRFATVQNREADRFHTFALFGEDIVSRIIANDSSYDVNQFVQEIDYEKVNEKLETEKDKSKAFIKEHLL